MSDVDARLRVLRRERTRHHVVPVLMLAAMALAYLAAHLGPSPMPWAAAPGFGGGTRSPPSWFRWRCSA